jgi:NAD-dependent deacetylase
VSDLQELLADWREGTGALVFLTGAGVSAESGIPTFRGADGYWRAGSVNYSPMQLATAAMFATEPETVWCWYLARFRRAQSAEPNDAHRAVARVQAAYPERSFLVTQNVDGLHQRAGSPLATTFSIHGSGLLMRCSPACTDATSPLPPIDDGTSSEALSAEMRARLTCKKCGGWMRPHVLWFDEYYDELHYRSDTAVSISLRATLLVTAGTTGATSLPFAIGNRCARNGVPIIDINPNTNPFAELSEQNGLWLRESASSGLTKIAELLDAA